MALAKDMGRYGGRKRTSVIAMALCLIATGIGLTALAVILGTLLWKGFGGLAFSVFSQDTPPPGGTGGLRNAIYGSLLMTGIGVALGTPIGILAGTYLAEYGRHTKLTEVVRFINDILLSAPSIVIGLFIYSMMVKPMGHFSGFAGGIVSAAVDGMVVAEAVLAQLLGHERGSNKIIDQTKFGVGTIY